MDYSFFDGLIDSIFVINNDKGIVYCNEAAANLCNSSVRRLAKGKPIFDYIQFSDTNLFVMPTGEVGKDAPSPYAEMKYKLKDGKEGKVQVAIQPFSDSVNEKLWVVMVRDVTLEEVLHAKYHLQLQEKEVYIEQLKNAQKQLEDYSKNLEKMVEDRTIEVKKANIMLSAIMDSLGQGFLVFDQAGNCSDFYTKACNEILETSPARKNILDVLKIPAAETETFEMWKTAVFSEKLPFDSIKELGPAEYKHSAGNKIKLDYFPLRDDDQKISSLVLVATDYTSEYRANVALEKEKMFARMVVKLITSKRQFEQFLKTAETLPRELKKTVQMQASTIDHESIFRDLHTLEGEAAIFSAAAIWQAARDAQTCLEPLKNGGLADIQKIRMELLAELENLDQTQKSFFKENSELLSMVGIGKADKVEVDRSEIENLLNRIESQGVSSKVCDEVADALLREPLIIAFRHYQDVVSTVATKLGKEVLPLHLVNLDEKIYLENYQNLFSAFVHAFRNAVDHGIESPEDREMLGKPRKGKIEVSASRLIENNQSFLQIVMSDDGQGISADVIRSKLVGRMPEAKLNSLTDSELIQFVFDSGLSTKDEISEYSGRGIGMNAIKVEAEKLGGRAWVETQPGSWTKLFVKVPDLPRLANRKKAA